ncbi:MAG TPA: LPS export ABC transporter periplasmic protein LptC, partial [Saprospiraceae bacterium]|nr:LPS export ABC transporter periplasmic protein LptC [Saprospiraceae bacterium]
PKDFVNKETFKSVELLYSDSAIVRVRVVAPSMIRHLDRREPRQEFDKGIKVDFFGLHKNVQSKLSANYAIRLINEKKVIARDSVELHSVQNEKLETSELIWDERKQKIYTNKFVMISTPEEKIWGYGFEANQGFTKWSIKAIEGELKVKDLK